MNSHGCKISFNSNLLYDCFLFFINNLCLTVEKTRWYQGTGGNKVVTRRRWTFEQRDRVQTNEVSIVAVDRGN